jgi:uncharacterized protein (DUF58 family)
VSAEFAAFGPRLRAALLAASRVGIRGVGAQSARRSDGYEFAELRGYVEGDDPRRIDWAATARAGTLQTRVVFEDRALSLAAAVDASQSMHVGRARSNYDLALEAARAFYAAAHDDDRCARIGERALIFRDLRGRRAAEVCGAYADAPGTPFDAALRLALATLSRGTRLLVVSDFFELDALAGLVRGCAERFDLTALVARDPWHDGLPLGGFVRLRDAETGEIARAFVDRRARERFARAVVGRERAAVALLRRAGARVGMLDASGAVAALAGAFAVSV